MFNIPKSRGSVELIAPANVSAPNNTAGFSWAWSGYSQIEAAAANGMVLLGIAYVYGAAAVANLTAPFHIQFQVATGAAGSEVVCADFAADGAVAFTFVTGSQMLLSVSGFLPCEPVIIPAGTRTSYRCTSNVPGGSAAIWTGLYLVGAPVSAFTLPSMRLGRMLRALRGMTPGAIGRWRSQVIPSGGPGVAVPRNAATPAWTFGTWTNIINGSGTAVAGELLVLGVVTEFYNTVVACHRQIEIGLGSSPVSVAAMGIPGRFFMPNPGDGPYMLPRPIHCKPGEIVSIRSKASIAEVTTSPHSLIIAEVP